MHVKLDVFLSNLIAAAVILLSILPVQIPLLQLILGLPLAIYIPGHMLVVAFSTRKLEREEHFVFSLGLSLEIMALSGLLLNAWPVGQTPTTWAFWLGTVVLIADVKMALRPPVQSPQGSLGFKFKFPSLTLSQYLLFAASIIITCAAFYISAQNIPYYETKFTQLWLMRDDENVDQLNCGILNSEGIPIQYKLQLQTSGGQVVHEWSTITLDHQERWNGEYTLLPNQTGVILAVLYRLDQPDTIYRYVFLQNSESKASAGLQQIQVNRVGS